MFDWRVHTHVFNVQFISIIFYVDRRDWILVFLSFLIISIIFTETFFFLNAFEDTFLPKFVFNFTLLSIN